MFGFSSLATAFGMVSVRETSTTIKITGIPGDYLANTIAATYKKSGKVVKSIFIDIGKNSLTFDRFFVIEVHLMFMKLSTDATPYRARRISKKIVEELEENTWLKDTLKPFVKPMIDLDYLSQFKLIPAPHQMNFLNEFGENVPRYQLRGYLLASPPGTGKALPLDAPVKVPKGWTTIGELEVGDEAIAVDGSIAKICGIIPQGVKSGYLLTFSDGRSVKACVDHLWSASLDGVVYSLHTTQEIKEFLDKGISVHIPLCLPEEGEDENYFIHPYAVGSLLASTGSISIDVGQYTRGSKMERYHFVQGLLDTGSFIDPEGRFCYRVKSEVDLKWATYFIRSLGGTALHDPDKGCIVITHPDPESLVRMPQRKVGITAEHKDTTLQVVSLEESVPEEMVCISISHPEQLFITKDFIVTHNTFMDLALAAVVMPRSIAEIKIIVSPKNAVDLVWAQDMPKYFKDVPTCWTSTSKGPAPTEGVEYYIFHFEALDRAIDLGKELVKLGKKYFVIIDECHNFNNPNAIRTKNLVNMCIDGQAFSVWASGSPIKAMGTEVIPLLRAIDPKFTPDVEAKFKRAFGGDVEYANDLLYNRIGKISFKIPKTDVIKDKPIVIKRRVKLKDPTPFLTDTVKVEMKDYIEKRLTDLKKDMGKYEEAFDSCLSYVKSKLRTSSQQKEFQKYVEATTLLRKRKVSGFEMSSYLAFTKDYEKRVLLPLLPQDMRNKFKESRSIVKSLLLKVRGEALGRILSKRRAECSIELAKHCNLPEIVNEGLGKTLIYSSYTIALNAGDKYMRDKGYTTTRVYGDTAKQVTSLVKEFTNKEEINPLFASYPALSTAVPVIIANQIVMLDLPTRNYIWDQTVSRALRYGQKHPVYVFEVLLDTGDAPNVSTRGDEIISWSREQVSALLGDDFGGPKEDEYEIERIDSDKLADQITKV